MLNPKDLRASIEAGKEIEVEERKREEKKRPRWEYVLFAVVVAFSVSILVWIRVSEIDHFKRMLLHTELWQMRNAIYMYYSIHKDLPESLGEFVNSSVVHPESGQKIPFVENVHVDRYGRVVDPFGHPYLYDDQKGTIKSQSPCCRDW